MLSGMFKNIEKAVFPCMDKLEDAIKEHRSSSRQTLQQVKICSNMLVSQKVGAISCINYRKEA
jgi:hypothetical protein